MILVPVDRLLFLWFFLLSLPFQNSSRVAFEWLLVFFFSFFFFAFSISAFLDLWRLIGCYWVFFYRVLATGFRRGVSECPQATLAATWFFFSFFSFLNFLRGAPKKKDTHTHTHEQKKAFERRKKNHMKSTAVKGQRKWTGRFLGSLPHSHLVLMGSTRFYWVLPSFTEFYWVLPSFTEFYLVLLGCIKFYGVLPSNTVFYWVLPSL